MDPHFGLMSTYNGFRRPSYRCLMCPSPKFLETKRSLRDHMSLHTREKLYHCPVCQMEFLTKRNLKRHQALMGGHGPNITNPGDVVQCTICEMTFDGNWLLKRHYTDDHNITEKQRETEKSCNLCNARFENNWSLNRHLIDIHKLEEKFICEEPNCGKKFFRRATLLAHRRRLHPVGFIYHCDVCHNRFDIQEDFRKHKKKVHGDSLPRKKHLCDLCGKFYCDRRSLLKHHKVKHDPSRPRVKASYKCDFEGCGRSFHKKSVLQYHMISHIKEKNHQCEHCGETFKRVKNLKIHILEKHPEVSYFKCKDCSESFHKFPQLQQHREKFHPSKNQRLGLGK